MWNGFSMISKRPELTDGMMQTLDEAERSLSVAPGNPTQASRLKCNGRQKGDCVTCMCLSVPPSAENGYSVDDLCVIHLLKGLCLKNQGLLQAAEECFQKVFSR